MVERLMKFQEKQMGKYWVVLLMGWLTLAAAGEEMRVSGAGLTAEELLDKYAEGQKAIYQSFRMKLAADITSERSWTDIIEKGKRKAGSSIEIRFDGNRFYSCYKLWGNCFPDAVTYCPKEDPRVHYWKIWNGRNYYKSGMEPDWMLRDNLEKNPNLHNLEGEELERYFKERRRVFIYDTIKDRSHIPKSGNGIITLGRMDFYFTDMCGGGVFFYEPELESALRKAEPLVLRKKTETISGSECYVMEAHEKDSDYKLWIDPSHGYNLAKFQKQSRLRSERERDKLLRYDINDVIFKQMDGVWVPMEADYLFSSTDNNGIIKSKIHIKITDIQINPDHEALGSFIPDFPKNGWGVRIEEFENTDKKYDFSWQDGKVVDKAGKVMMSYDEPNEAGENKSKEVN